MSRSKFKHVVIAAAATVLIAGAAFSASTALAAKGGNGGGHKGGGQTSGGTATLTVSPNPVVAGGSLYTISGTGLAPNAGLNVSVASPYCCFVDWAVSDANGNFTITELSQWPGTYTVTVRELTDTGWITAGSISFDAVAP